MDTINRLLKKQAPKRRGRAPGLATAAASADTNMTDVGGAVGSTTAEAQNGTTTAVAAGGGGASEAEMGSAVYVRWVNSKKGSLVAVPQEWLDAPMGRVFSPSTTAAAKASSWLDLG